MNVWGNKISIFGPRRQVGRLVTRTTWPNAFIAAEMYALLGRKKHICDHVRGCEQADRCFFVRGLMVAREAGKQIPRNLKFSLP